MDNPDKEYDLYVQNRTWRDSGLQEMEMMDGQSHDYLYIIQEDEFPTIEMSSDSNVHIFYGCPLEPATRLF